MVEGTQGGAANRGFLERLERLQIRIRIKLDLLRQGGSVFESSDQLTWALEELERIGDRYRRKLPWPAGAMDQVVRESWPLQSDLRADLTDLEKEFYAPPPNR